MYAQVEVVRPESVLEEVGVRVEHFCQAQEVVQEQIDRVGLVDLEKVVRKVVVEVERVVRVFDLVLAAQEVLVVVQVESGGFGVRVYE